MPPEKAVMAGRVLRFLPSPKHVPRLVDRTPRANQVVHGTDQRVVLNRVVRCTPRVEWLPQSVLSLVRLRQKRVALLEPRLAVISAATMVESRGEIWRLQRGVWIKR
jgi:hypothetical protein